MKISAEDLMFKPEDFKTKPLVQPKTKLRATEKSGVASSSSRSISKKTEGKEGAKSGVEDPLAEFYAEAKAQAEHNGRAGVRS